MKPTAPGGLQEKWIIPIIREVAEAMKWVHQAGIIHRDIKCRSPRISVFVNSPNVFQAQMSLSQSWGTYSSVTLVWRVSLRTS